MSETQKWEQEHAETRSLRALRALAREYHERTEAFDHTHCRMRDRRGMGMPLGVEVRECTLFALEQHRQLGRYAAYLGFNPREWADAIFAESRHFESDWDNGLYRDDPRFKIADFVSHAPSAT